MPVVQVGERALRIEPLWARVDRNRIKLGLFVVAFVAGSAVLVALALVAVPGVLLGWGADIADVVPAAQWFSILPWCVGAAVVLALLTGAVLTALQLANAEDWVGNRFSGRRPSAGEVAGLSQALTEMGLAAGLPVPPSLLILDVPTVNAFALGTTRHRPVIGVTQGFLSELTADEQTAVIATLVARICAGDILFGTALAALMGPLTAIRESRRAVAGSGVGGCSGVDGCSAANGCSDGCSGCSDIGDLGDGCAGAVGIAVFLALVALLTYIAVVVASWIVTLWGRALQRTSYEKADAEGMLLLRDPAPMLSALRKVIASATAVGDGDPSYDGIFYAPTSGTTRVEPGEQRRLRRLREVLGVEGLATGASDTKE